MIRTRTSKGLVAGGIPRLNLLPPGEIENRHRRLLWKRWMRASYLAFISIALQVGVASNLSARLVAVDTAQAQTSAQLQSQLAAYSQVVDLSAATRRLEDFRAEAGSTDQAWEPLVTRIRAVLPGRVTLTGFTLTPGAAPVAGVESSAQVGLKGTLTLSARTASAQAQTVTRLRTVGSLIAVDAGQLSADSAGNFTFIVTFSADQTRYSRRFTASGAK
jgi:hypothetical protein